MYHHQSDLIILAPLKFRFLNHNKFYYFISLNLSKLKQEINRKVFFYQIIFSLYLLIYS